MNPIDKKIREKFQNHQSRVDTDALWKEVYPSIRKKKKPYLGFLLIASLSILTTSFFWYISTNNKLSTSNASAIQEIEIEEKSAFNELNNTPIINAESKINNSEVIENRPKTQVKNQTKSDQKLKNIKIENQTKRLLKIIKESTSQKEDQKMVPSFQYEKTKTNTNTKDIKRTIIVEAIPKKTVAEINVEPKSNKALASKQMKHQLRNSGDVLSLKQAEIKPLIAQAKQELESPAALTEKNKRTWFISPSFGVYLTNRDLRTEDRSMDALITERNLKEDQLETVIGALAIGTMINERWGASFGLNYRETNELSENIIQTQDTVLKDNILIEERNLPNGEKEQIYGSAFVPRTIISEEGKYIKYQGVSAFADVLYRFNTNKIIWEAQLGLQQNLLLSAKGNTISLEEGFYNIEEDREEILSKNSGLSLRTSLGINIPINNKWSLKANTRYIKDFGSLFSKESGIIQKYQLLGINAGIQLAF